MKQKTLSLLGSILLTAIFSVMIISCGNGSDDQINDETDSIEETTVIEKADKLVYPLPTPLEITEMLNKAGASYILDIANSPENVDKYFTEMAKAMNLGVYGADLSYASTYNKTQETNNYLACTIKLRDGLAIETPLNASLLEKVETNIENKDSLYQILTTSFHETFEYLNDNGKGAVSVMILTGGWIEGVYLSTELALLTDNNAEILKGIADQKETLKTLIPLLETYKEDENVAKVLTDLNNIETIYNEVVEKDGVVELTQEQFNKIKEEIEALRKSVVETT
ncbi:MAG: hypothetical protein B6I20_00720 [Bacteroidetes bacterium 4572_117]|nr:MAG: hypothetical protein B6I20_00720 [Bacteroidetes bacterium 4572_117]